MAWGLNGSSDDSVAGVGSLREGMPIRILLVDSHEDARHSLVRAIESDGRLVVSAAVATVADVGPNIGTTPSDVSLLNIQSRERESTVQCRELRLRTGIPIFVHASFMTEGHWRALRRAGAVDYLLKHANGRELCSAIVRLAERHGLSAPAVAD